MRGYQGKKSAGRWLADTLVATLAIGSLFAGYMVAVAGVSDGGLEENMSTYYYEVAEFVAPSENKVITPQVRGVYAKGAVEINELVACDKSTRIHAVSHLKAGPDACPHETETSSI